MAGKLDLLRSLLRGAADVSRNRLAKLGPVERARYAFEELKERRTRVSETALSTAVAHIPGVRQASVSIHDGRVIADATWDDGRTVAISVVPEHARFAPRGAKEILFAVDPPEMARDARAREIVGAIAAAIARALWGPVLRKAPASEVAMTDRDGDKVRVDLRSIPAVDALLNGSPFSQVLEVLSIESFTIEDRSIRVRIALPIPGVSR